MNWLENTNYGNTNKINDDFQKQNFKKYKHNKILTLFNSIYFLRNIYTVRFF